MASSRDYLEYILDNLTELDNITYKAMMGEFIIYYDGVVVGGIYDNRLLVKITKSLDDLIPDFPKELPYKGVISIHMSIYMNQRLNKLKEQQIMLK